MYGKIRTFLKKEAAFQRWVQGESFADITKNLKVAEATAEIYTLDMIASGRGEVTMVNKLLKELEIGGAIRPRKGASNSLQRNTSRHV